jgi:hypothetical protein
MNQQQLLAIRAHFGLDALMVDFNFIGLLPCLDRDKPAKEQKHTSKNAVFFTYQSDSYYVTSTGFLVALTLDKWGNIQSQKTVPYGTGINSKEHSLFLALNYPLNMRIS